MNFVRALVVGLALLLPGVPAAAEEEASAQPFTVFRPNDDETTTVAAVCHGSAIRTTATVVVTCEIEDASGVRSSATCESAVSHGVCATAPVLDAVGRVAACAEVVATFSDDHTASDRSCVTFG